MLTPTETNTSSRVSERTRTYPRGFTAVGIPASMRRFGALRCYDNFRPARLPAILQDANPGGRAWRFVDGSWTRDDVVKV
jgi:hypothetical protein